MLSKIFNFLISFVNKIILYSYNFLILKKIESRIRSKKRRKRRKKVNFQMESEESFF